MFKHLLVPTDGSPLSQEAVTRAIGFARDSGARITFCHAGPAAPGFFAGAAIDGAPAHRALAEPQHAAARSLLDAAVRQASEAGVPADAHAVAGAEPYVLIVQTAEALGCDLIFMASHGRRGATALLLGSETNKVLTHCQIPVLVYR